MDDYEEENEEESNRHARERPFETGMFGVFYTISREKETKSKKIAILTIFIDFFQMVAFALNPSFGWALEVDNIWVYLKNFTFNNPLVSFGYNFFVAGFVFCAMVLLVSLGICVMVGHHFKTNSFPWLWPVKFVRTIFSIFIGVFFISTLNVFLLTFSCVEYTTSSGESFYYLQNFPDKRCWVMPHAVIAVLGMIFSVMLVMTALGVALTSFEPSLNTKDLLASAVGRREFQEYVYKTAMTLAQSLMTNMPKVQAGVFFAASFLLVYDMMRFVPFYHQWINTLHNGLLCVVVWCAGMLLVKTVWISPTASASTITYICLGGIPVAFLLGVGLMFFRLRMLDGTSMLEVQAPEETVTEPTENDTPGGGGRKVVPAKTDSKSSPSVGELRYRVKKDFVSDRHPEIAVRFVQGHAGDEKIVAAGTALLEHAIRQYPDSASVHIVYSSFILAYAKHIDMAQVLLDRARDMHPSFLDRFCLFLRERERKQRLQAASSGAATMDLVAYIEFQNMYKVAVNSYRGTLRALREFWRIVVSPEVSMATMSNSFRVIDSHQERAERTYQTMLQKYPKSAAALRSYGRFLENIQGDALGAQKYFSEADRQDAAAKKDGDASKFDEKIDATIVCNSSGTITFVNNVMCKLFGWKKEDLIGRNVAVLVPSPIAEQHDKFIQRYIQTGKSSLIGATRNIEGKHRQGHSFGLQVSLSRIDTPSGITFMAIFRPVTDDDLSKVTINAYGIIQNCTKSAVTMFGYSSQDEMIGQNVQMLMDPRINHDEILKRRRERGADMKVEFAARRLLARRADGTDFPAVIDLERKGDAVESMTFTAVIRDLGADVGVIGTNEIGTVMSVSKQAADLVGWTGTSLIGQNISKIMAPPYSAFHDFWLKRYKTTGVSAIVDVGRRISVLHKDGTLFEASLTVAVSESGGRKTYLARLKNCDSRVAETHRVEGKTACSVSINENGEVCGLHGGAARIFDEPDGSKMIGRAFGMLFVEDDITPQSLLQIPGGMLLTPAVSKIGGMGELCVVRCDTAIHEPGTAYRIGVYTLAGLEPIIALRQDGTIVYCNESSSMLFGKATVVGLLGRNVKELFRDLEKAGLTTDDLERIVQGSTKSNKPVTGRRSGVAIRTASRDIGVIVEAAPADKNAFYYGESAEVVVRLSTVGARGVGEEWSAPAIGKETATPRPISAKSRVVRFTSDLEQQLDALKKEAEVKLARKGIIAVEEDEYYDEDDEEYYDEEYDDVIEEGDEEEEDEDEQDGRKKYNNTSSRQRQADDEDEHNNDDEREEDRRSHLSMEGGGTSADDEGPSPKDAAAAKRKSKVAGSPNSAKFSSGGRFPSPRASSPSGSNVKKKRKGSSASAASNGSKSGEDKANLHSLSRKGSQSSSRGSFASSTRRISPEEGLSDDDMDSGGDVGGVILRSFSAPDKKGRPRFPLKGGKLMESFGEKSPRMAISDDDDDLGDGDDDDDDDVDDAYNGTGGGKGGGGGRGRGGRFALPGAVMEVKVRSSSGVAIKQILPEKKASFRAKGGGGAYSGGLKVENGDNVRSSPRLSSMRRDNGSGSSGNNNNNNNNRATGSSRGFRSGRSSPPAAAAAVGGGGASMKKNSFASSHRIEYVDEDDEIFDRDSGDEAENYGGRFNNSLLQRAKMMKGRSASPSAAWESGSQVSLTRRQGQQVVSLVSNNANVPELISRVVQDKDERWEDEDDDRSQKSDGASSVSSASSMSSVNSTTSVLDSGTGLSRNKKFKKVARVLRLKRFRRMTQSLRNRVWVSIILFILAELCFFISNRIEVQNQTSAASRLVLGSSAAEAIQRVTTAVSRVPFTPTSEWATVAKTIRTETTEFETMIKDWYFPSTKQEEMGPLLEDNFNAPTVEIVEWFDTHPVSRRTRRMVGLWEFSRMAINSAFDVAVMLELNDPTINIPETPSWKFITENVAEALCPKLVEGGGIQESRWLDGVSSLRTTFVLFVIMQILIMALLWAFVITPLFNSVFIERLKIFGHFMAVPPGVALKMATATIAVDDDDDDEMGEGGGGGDGEDGEEGKKEGSEDDGWDEGAAAAIAGGVNFNSTAGGGAFVSGRGFASAKNGPTIAELQAELKRQQEEQRRRRRHRRRKPTLDERISEFFQRLFVESAFAIKAKAFFKKWTVKAAQHFLGWHLEDAAKTRRARRRQLSIGPDRSRLQMAAPMFLVIVMLGLSLYVSLGFLSSFAEPCKELHRSDQRSYLAMRVHYLCGLIVYTPDTWNVTGPLLNATINSLRSLHEELRASESDHNLNLRSLLYDDGCLRSDKGYCRSSSDIYWSVVNNGLDALLLTFMREATLFTEQQPVHINATTDPHWLLLDSVAWTDLGDGLETAEELTLTEAQARPVPFDTVPQSLIFSAVIVTLGIFLMMGYRPFEKKANADMKRAAIMLAILPDYIDLATLI